MFCAVFWNVGGKSSRSGIVRLITGLQRQEDADVLVLAECSTGLVGSVLRGLNVPDQRPEFAIAPTTSRMTVLVRRTVTLAREVDRHKYFSIMELSRGSGPNLILASAHMVSLLEKEAAHVDKELEKFAEVLRRAEEVAGNKYSIVIGDLNAHPFSEGVAASVGLHGVMSRVVAGRGERQASFRKYPFLFNPMWQFYGDAASRPPGTYYREPGGDHTGYFWHMFDQVLIRPSLIPYYQDDSVCIVTNVAGTTLAGDGWIPDSAIGSDHYPVRIRLTC